MIWERVRRRLGIEADSADMTDGSSVARSFADESVAGLRLTIRGRLLALAVLALLLPAIAPYPDFLLYYALLGFFALATLGLTFLQKRQRVDSRLFYVLIAIDFAALSLALLYSNPLADAADLREKFFESSKFTFYYIFLVVLAFNYQPRLVLSGGCIGALFWLIGSVWLYVKFEQAGSLPEFRDALAGLVLDPEEDILDTSEWLESRIEEAILFILSAVLLALVVQRSRQLVVRQVHLARERNNLARYFPPSMIDDISRIDTPLGAPRELIATVLFADIVGFTKWSEGRPSQEVIALLREVHTRFEDCVFKHAGTLDKYMGDGIMATFGTPQPQPDDAANALRCALDLRDSFAEWNASRRTAGLAEVEIAIGMHTGPVVMGDIGSARRLELAVLGDTVNLASRLEGLTRNLDCKIALSEATVEAIRSALPAEVQAALLGELSYHGPVTPRGRTAGIDIWTA